MRMDKRDISILNLGLSIQRIAIANKYIYYAKYSKKKRVRNKYKTKIKNMMIEYYRSGMMNNKYYKYTFDIPSVNSLDPTIIPNIMADERFNWRD